MNDFTFKLLLLILIIMILFPRILEWVMQMILPTCGISSVSTATLVSMISGGLKLINLTLPGQDSFSTSEMANQTLG